MWRLSISHFFFYSLPPNFNMEKVRSTHYCCIYIKAEFYWEEQVYIYSYMSTIQGLYVNLSQFHCKDLEWMASWRFSSILLEANARIIGKRKDESKWWGKNELEERIVWIQSNQRDLASHCFLYFIYKTQEVHNVPYIQRSIQVLEKKNSMKNASLVRLLANCSTVDPWRHKQIHHDRTAAVLAP